MANLEGLNIDANVDENSGEFVVLPAGKYKACIVDDELKDTKSGTGKLLAVKLQITEGQFAGETIIDNINILNPNPKAQAIGQGTLKRICGLCGVIFPPQDTEGLKGRQLGIDVKVETFISNASGKELKSNKIRAYGPAPKSSQQAQQQQSNQEVNNVTNTAW